MAINVHGYIIYLLNISKEDRNVRSDMINVKHSVYVHALFTYIFDVTKESRALNRSN